MKQKNPIAITFSDLHINDWTKFNDFSARTKSHLRVLAQIAIECERLSIPAIFCGDLFHKPNMMNQDLLVNIIHPFFKDLEKYFWKCYAIEGNHDLSKVNSIDKPTKGWVSYFSDIYSWMEDISFKTIKLNNDIELYGVPYIDHNKGLREYLKGIKVNTDIDSILVLHTDYPGAKDTDGRVVNSVENIDQKMLSKFDLVLCGHIHKSQKLSKNVYMVGAPLQQRRTDMNCKMGYWMVYDDLSMEFIELKGYPKFIDVESQDDVENDGNYYTIIPPKQRDNSVIEHKITKQVTNKTLVRRYMKVKGLKDKGKRKLLLNIINKSQSDNI